MKAVGVIPARIGSSRLSEKVLKLIDGRPMIQRVWLQAKQAKKLSGLIVACDDKRIQECVEAVGGKAVLTRPDHPNGSSRVAEIAEREKADVLINIQGDEPMIHPEGIDQIVEVFEKKNDLQVATLAVRRRDREDYLNPNVVKVVCDAQGNALYFSRAPIPHFRGVESGPVDYLKHLGIYGYRREFLIRFVGWNTGVLEDCEKLEQLRILEQGYKINVLETAHDSFSVDTLDDLKSVELKIKNLSAKAGAY